MPHENISSSILYDFTKHFLSKKEGLAFFFQKKVLKKVLKCFGVLKKGQSVLGFEKSVKGTI